MKKKKPLLSRKAKTLIYISIVLVGLTVIIAGDFPLTPWSAFLLAEKAHLLKPATIVGTESVVSAGQDTVIVAETEEFCITYGYKFFGTNTPDNLVCKKKTGDLTFLSIAPTSKYGGDDDKYCSIILFDEYPQAVRAKLWLKPYMEFMSNGTKTSYEGLFTVTATREVEEYFFFRLNWQEQNSGGLDSFLYDSVLISNLRRSLNDSSTVTDPVPGKIQLYDKDDNLILEREIDLQNPSKS